MNLLGVLLRQRLRRDRVQLALWIVGTAALAVMATTAVRDTFGELAEREGILRLTSVAPAILVFRGTPNGAEQGPFAFFLMFAFLALLAGLMSTFLAVRHTRGDEETGRAELVASTPASRLLPTAATVLHGVIANVVLGLGVAIAFWASGLDATGAFVAGAAVAACGVAFLAIGLVFAQLFRTSRAANGAGVAAVVAAYFVRGIGDAAGEPSADGLHRTPMWISWLSPIGWGQRTNAFAENDLAPLLLSIGFAAVLVALVFVFQSARDSGASVLPGLRGRDHAGPVLSGSLGLAWKLSIGAVVSWAAGAAVMGALATSLTQLVDRLGSDVPDVAVRLRQMAGADATLEQALTTTFFSVIGILASACALQLVIRARQEEAHGTAEAVLATPVPRQRWLGEYGAVALIGVVIVIAVSMLAAFAGAQPADDPAGMAQDAAEAAIAQLPAVLVFLGIGMLLFVLVPRVMIGAAWAVLTLAAFLGVFGELLGLPDWMHDLSPFAHSPVPIGDEVDWTGGIWMIGIGVAAIAVSIVLMRRRELAAGG
ncbi:ABC transporter permease [Agromyces aurantiacus]|uniref:ABC transporter permease n=1 Tax=Agromyces aurantiacus TaxID=165814 RepID=A0ABV9R4P9_9MICO|nr:polyketide antibiotic transporter [Agromyces aurantiacus]MBM7503233.1 ABC-2 type transport system permease protein [Agromyces aurantiacus]